MGEEWPLPERGVFHAMHWPLAPSHSRGSSVSALVPSPRGPRHPGQFSAEAVRAETKNRHNTATTQVKRGV
jgi:hypothetical protein